MLELTRIETANEDLAALISLLDAELAEYDGKEHSFYAQYNKLVGIHQMVVAYLDGLPVGCGALKAYDNTCMEMKRMYVKEEFRGKGVARAILAELESWVADSGFHHCILETGLKPQSALRLYEKYGYQVIPNYGQYAGVSNSVCMKKSIP